MNNRLAALVASLTVACGGSQPPPTSQKPPDTPPPVADDTPSDPREALLRAALERARAIQDEVAALRGLRFNHPVPAERQSIPEFRKVVVRELEKVFPASKSRRTSKALFHVGVLATQTDLATAVTEIAVGQVAAYYNPETGRFYAVKLSDDKDWLEIMTAHELTHGLQDQHFDLRHYVGEPSPTHPNPIKLTDDQINARRFVVEGEASFVMWMFKALKEQQRETPDSATVMKTRMQVAMVAAVPWRAMVRAADNAPPEDGAKRATKLSQLPPYLVVPTLQSYTMGADAISAAYVYGGWDAVTELYAVPPESTEQMLHAREKLFPTRDHPTEVAIPVFTKRLGAPLLSETLGELGWRTYLETWDVPAADVAAEGWDGDQLVVYDTPEGPLGLLAFVWDSEDDAIEFENAFRRSARARTNRGSDSGNSGVTRYRRAEGGEILVRRDGTKVFVVDGAKGKRADSYLSTIKGGTRFTEVP